MNAKSAWYGLAIVLLFLGACRDSTPEVHASSSPAAEAQATSGAALGIEADAIAFPIKVEPAASRAFTEETTAVAVIAPLPDRAADLAFRTGGRIETLGPSEGARVRAGLVLGTLAERSLAAAQARTAEANLARDRELFAKGIVARRQVEAAELAAHEARARVASAEVVAPFAGTIVRRHHNVGEIVDPGVAVLSVMDLTAVWAVASVFESDLRHFREGQAVAVTTGATPGRRFAGRVVLVSDVMDATSRTFQVKAKVPNLDRALKVGMTARLVAIQGSRRALAAPVAALVDGPGGGKLVFVREGARYEARPVMVGAATEVWAEITDGVEAGELVVVQGQYELRAAMAGAAPAADDD